MWHYAERPLQGGRSFYLEWNFTTRRPLIRRRRAECSQQRILALNLALQAPRFCACPGRRNPEAPFVADANRRERKPCFI